VVALARPVRKLARRPLPSLADRYSGRANSINFLRLVLAFAVLLSHTWPLALDRADLGNGQTHGQTDVGRLAVFGFFALSGFLITNSALRFTLPRYLWHRALRILPGFWACIILTAFVAAPVAALYERGTLAGLWSHPQGPWQYLQANWLLGMRQWPIGGLLSGVPYAGNAGGAFDGSLWSLKYEFLCYLLVAALAVTAVLTRARRVVLLLAAAGYWVIVEDFVRTGGWRVPPPSHGALGPYPLIGGFNKQLLIYLLFLFLVGSAARLYAHRLPMHGALAVLALAALALSMRYGGFTVFGLPAWGYLVLYASVALPTWLHRVGRQRDYSYGIYIYAFPVQQLVALFIGVRYGLAVFLALSTLGTMVLAVLSWHLVERPAMSLKDWTPRFGRRREEVEPPVEGTPVAPPPRDLVAAPTE
jgi:peptidoglycan/LPS O-acetylase OafA/YrhL